LFLLNLISQFLIISGFFSLPLLLLVSEISDTVELGEEDEEEEPVTADPPDECFGVVAGDEEELE